jgi:hypothetical protein
MRRALLAALIPAVRVGLWLGIAALTNKGSSIEEAAVRGTSSSAEAQNPATPLRAHPQAVQPAAGVITAPQATESVTPVGDPNAHARSLAEVKRELKILNRCGGATSAAFATPVVKANGPGFVPDPGTIQNVGQLAVLTARLDTLAKAIGVTIYGISGYRTPAHNVAVGGYADDPHTKGLAEDIGVGSLLRSSAAQISEAQLAQFGLYRPFDPSGDPNKQ